MPKYEKQLTQAAGYVGFPPEIRPGQDGEWMTFRLGVNTSYGEGSETKWLGVSVSKPELMDWVQANVRKGSAVVVEGVEKEVERNGNIYHNFQAYRVGLVNWFVRGTQPQRDDEDL